MSLFVRACCQALREFPEVNASIEGDDIVYHNFCDIGVAVGSEKGLVVPVLRGAESHDAWPRSSSASRSSREKIRTQPPRHRRPGRGHLHRLQRRHLRLAPFHPDSQPAAKRGARHARHPGPRGGAGRRRS